MLVVIPASMGNVWRVAGIMEDDDSRDRGEGEVGGVTEEDMIVILLKESIRCWQKTAKKSVATIFPYV